MAPEQDTDTPKPAPSRRERSKQEYLDRIKAAAEAVFIEKGFDDASIREIATRADVGVGTVFNYAADKRDLLFLVVNEKLEATNQRAYRDVPDTLPLVEQILIVFRYYYLFYAENIEIGRYMLQESTLFGAGEQGQRFQEHRLQIATQMTNLLRRAQDRGEIAEGEDPALVAELVLSILGRQVRVWIRSKEPEVETGLIPLRDLLSLMMRGAGAS